MRVVDAAIQNWPVAHVASFVSAYSRIEPWLERHKISLLRLTFDRLVIEMLPSRGF